MKFLLALAAFAAVCIAAPVPQGGCGSNQCSYIVPGDEGDAPTKRDPQPQINNIYIVPGEEGDAPIKRDPEPQINNIYIVPGEEGDAPE
ncbi:hypothetical protein GGS20DRAFT_585981 [Poronia punctata]|nr:hypothetical protein GGS20DRAFT_585981 [Poronia punctata]